MMFLVVSFALFGLGMAGGSCPAVKNDGEGHFSKSLFFISALNGGKCRDMSKRCEQCADKCANPEYSKWMDSMCAKTCGLCQDDAGKLQGQSFCWKYNQGYHKSDSNVLKTVSFTNMYECERLCLKEDRCVGAAVSEFFHTSSKLCVLAKEGAQIGTQKYYFGATKECMKSNPGKPCQDYWDRCACCMSRMCNCCCSYYKLLTAQVCQKTCNKCSEEDNEKEEEEETTWKKLVNVKLMGNIGQKGLSLEDAKGAHCPSCGGISCNTKGKCNVMTSVKKEKKKKGFTSYEPIKGVGLFN